MVKALFAQVEEYDRNIFWALAGLFIALSLSYVYFLTISVSAVISRKQHESALVRLTAELSEHEARYVALGRSIDLARAHKDGFRDIAVPQYVTRVPAVPEFTLRDMR